jgi:hypothetical protein
MRPATSRVFHVSQGVAMINLLPLLLTVSMSAAPSTGLDPVRLMFLDASSCKFIIMQNSMPDASPADKAKYEADRATARADMKTHAADAIKYPGGSADMESAIKAFYTAADSYCGNPTGSAEEDYKAKKRALDQMLQAVGR